MTTIKITFSPYLFERIDNISALYDILKLREKLCLCILNSILQGYPLAYNDILYPYCDNLLMKNEGAVYFGGKLIINADDEQKLLSCVESAMEQFEQYGILRSEVFAVKVGIKYIGSPWCTALDDDRWNEISGICSSLCSSKSGNRAKQNISALNDNDIMIRLTVEHDINSMKPFRIREMSKQCFAQSEICEKYILKHGGALICSPGSFSLSVIPEDEWDFMRRMSEELLQKVSKVKGVGNVKVRMYRLGSCIRQLEIEGDI